ncbi:uncharacterized protein LOC131954555 [Physella acuta]|uniref:uncharacterized protein LOC131954555 n=1 Tax=Physella acuta TaxID=109671 RepID=UPI0027DD203A|nr:uncharacterized protein LOC131954555 [Physella acuta]
MGSKSHASGWDRLTQSGDRGLTRDRASRGVARGHSADVANRQSLANNPQLTSKSHVNRRLAVPGINRSKFNRKLKTEEPPEPLEYEWPDLPPLPAMKDALCRQKASRGIPYQLPVDESCIERKFQTDLRAVFQAPSRLVEPVRLGAESERARRMFLHSAPSYDARHRGIGHGLSSRRSLHRARVPYVTSCVATSNLSIDERTYDVTNLSTNINDRDMSSGHHDIKAMDDGTKKCRANLKGQASPPADVTGDFYRQVPPDVQLHAQPGATVLSADDKVWRWLNSDDVTSPFDYFISVWG